jgi:Tol biopolymer transport system component
MRCRALTVALLLLLFALPAAASGAVPDGPRLTFLRWTLRPPSRDIVTTSPDGSAEQIVLNATEGDVPVPRLYFSPSWSPDGSTLAFTGVVGERVVNDRGYFRTKIYLVGADGSGLRVVPGTAESFEPIFSPDGHTLAFTRKQRRWERQPNGHQKLVFVGNTAWLADLQSGQMRQLTPWRNHVAHVPSSFSPDGSMLAMTKRPRGEPIQAVTMSLASGRIQLLLREAFDPVYSPDGSSLAYLHGTVHRITAPDGGRIPLIIPNLFVARADGTEARNITGLSAAGVATPRWDPSGERLAYIQTDLTGSQAVNGVGDTVMEINRDGTCPTKIFSDPNVSFSGTVWQPGPGRQAGRIVC